MDPKRRFGILALVASSVAATAFADIASSPTLSAGQELNVSSGVLGVAGGDLQWTGTQINFLGSAKAFILTGNQTSSFGNLGLSQAQADASAMNQTPVTSPTVGTAFLMQANSGQFAKVLIATQSGTSVQLQFDTFSPAASGPITYTMTGTLQGNLYGSLNLNGNFTWQVMADTSGITNPSSGVYKNSSIRSYISINGLGNFIPLQNVTVTLNTTANTVTFSAAPNGAPSVAAITVPVAGFSFPSNLATVIGFVGSGGATLTPGALTTATGTTIAISGVSGGNPPKFQATNAPVIENIANAASNLIAGSTPAPIAQGSIFVIKGNALGPATLVSAPSGQIFQNTTVSNTSVTVTVGSTTVNALMYYTSAGQVAALLPSNTPTGTGLFSVIYNGVAGTPISHGITASDLGLFTVDSTGQGPGIVTFADYSLVSASPGSVCGGPYTSCGAANPGDTLILWATGLGPVSGSDAAGAGLGVAQSSVQLTLWLGGVQVPIAYQGRSGCCVGEDQVVFSLPKTGTLVPTGCAVPLVAQITNSTGIISSNTVVIPVASGSRTCTPTDPAQATIQPLINSGSLPFGLATVELSRNPGSGNNAIEDDARIKFNKVVSINTAYAPFFETYVDVQPPGTCVVYDNLNPGNNAPVTNIVDADGGKSMTLTGPSSTLAEAIQPGKTFVTLSPNGTFLTPGKLTASTTTAGADMGPVTGTITIPGAPTWTSPTQAALTAGITKANGLTITWTGGSANGAVFVTLQSPQDASSTNGVTASCIALGSAGTFTVPPYVMTTLGGFANLYLEQDAIPAPITGPGVGYGEISFSGFATAFTAMLQ